VKPLSVTTDEKLQHKRMSSVRLEKIPLSVWLNVVFMSTVYQHFEESKNLGSSDLEVWTHEELRKKCP